MASCGATLTAVVTAAAAATALFATRPWFSSVSSPRGDVRPGETMYDVDGQWIRAHQPYLFNFNSTVYWYGLDKVGASWGTAGVINVYTSTDFLHWEFRGTAFDCNAAGHDCYAFRPSMLHHPKTGKFIMWDQGGMSFDVAIADSPLGPFEMLGTRTPTSDSRAGDSQTFADPLNPGKAYMVYSQLPVKGPSGYLYEREMKIHRLTDDWTGIQEGGHVATLPGPIEAPAVFYSEHAQRYFVWSSHATYWEPNPALAHSARSMEGPWEELGNPSGSMTTFSTQGSSVLPLDAYSSNGAQRAVYVGDRFEPYIDTSEGSRYIFLPMEISAEGNLTLFNVASWSLTRWPTDHVSFGSRQPATLSTGVPIFV